MRYDYLIEIRPFIEKLKLKRKMRDLKTELRLRKTPRVPHITLPKITVNFTFLNGQLTSSPKF